MLFEKKFPVETGVTYRGDRLTAWHYVASFIFIWASMEQLRTNIILANLRKDKDGNVVTTEHKMSQDGLFKYISGPLQLTEITMYLSLYVILSTSATYPYILWWVIFNQVCKTLFIIISV